MHTKPPEINSGGFHFFPTVFRFPLSIPLLFPFLPFFPFLSILPILLKSPLSLLSYLSSSHSPLLNSRLLSDSRVFIYHRLQFSLRFPLPPLE